MTTETRPRMTSIPGSFCGVTTLDEDVLINEQGHLRNREPKHREKQSTSVNLASNEVVRRFALSENT
ncbi:hypothetical protein T265_11104 [Opisthorchis viverrini]|uniref:Uncharacterized protein n=1 Tax=Opisthorchis viverrini TaxID=6198 RepID=A0A074Z074_OPIVI|nr:hypothetical protein T265_11104 [Opisthorchis viverrini]KER20323.1 hypothetical protein T265_11104 [Opisthorchis viverrini]